MCDTVRRNWKAFLGAGVLAILVPLLAASEKSMKSLIDDWFETCAVVVRLGELEEVSGQPALPIQLFVQGEPPKRANLVLAANTEVFTKIEYWHDLDSINRALHPAIPIQENVSPTKNILVEITPFRSKLLYSFRTYVAPSKAAQIQDGTIQLAAFVQFPADTEEPICRVEKPSVFNSLVGKGAFARFLTMLFLVVLFAGSVALLRR